MSFSVYFFIDSLLLTLPICLFLGIKRILRKHLTIKGHAFSWYLFFLLLLLPFLPTTLFSKIFEEGFWIRKQLLKSFQGMLQDNRIAKASQYPLSATSLEVNRKIADFSLSIDRDSSSLSQILMGIWLLGTAVILLLTVFGLIQINRIRHRGILVTRSQEPELFSLFEACKKELLLKRRISLYRSLEISSPVSYGLFCPRIIIPEDLDIVFSKKEIRYILLHELSHHKRQDALLNNLRCIFQALYWFHPAVWYGLRGLSPDREMACDDLVIDTIGIDNSLDYGQTILLYAGKILKGTLFSPISGIGDSCSQLKKRIYQIANYQTTSFFQRLKSFFILTAVLLLILSGCPFFCSGTFAAAANQKSEYLENSSFHPEDSSSITQEDWSSYFDGQDGTFLLYDENQDSYEVYNESHSRQRFSPASTYKIYSGLFALEENIITPKKSQRNWDNNPYPFDSWNQNQDLTSAMQNSVNWYFQGLDKELGMKKLSSYYNKISYGNCDLSGGLSQYWRESSLEISPMEQVNLLVALYQNGWDFDNTNIQAVKEAMLISSHGTSSLYGKTGTGNINHQDINGWFIGMVENQTNTYYFSVHLKGGKNANGSQAASIALAILNAKGIYES